MTCGAIRLRSADTTIMEPALPLPMGTRKSGSGAIREPPIRAPSPMTLRRAIWTSVTCKTPKPFQSRIPAIEQEPTKRTEVWKRVARVTKATCAPRMSRSESRVKPGKGLKLSNKKKPARASGLHEIQRRFTSTRFFSGHRQRWPLPEPARRRRLRPPTQGWPCSRRRRGAVPA
jgi:hypothetical protein